MNIIHTTLLILLSICTISQEENMSIEGNWYVVNNFQSERWDYTEVYINKNYYRDYNEYAGLGLSKPYELIKRDSIAITEYVSSKNKIYR